MKIKEPSQYLSKKVLFSQECLKMENAALENMSVIRRIFPISGAGNRHNITSVNIIASLHSSLKARRLNDLESLYVTLPTG
jgi:hypothetical protein